MATVTLKAHFDGKHIVLDEPFEFPLNAKLAVMVVSPAIEREDWSQMAAENLARAYGDAEPDYTAADLKK